MRKSNLGQSFQSFGPNWRMSLAWVAIGGFSSWLFYAAAREFHGWIAWTLFYVTAIGFGLLTVRHLFFRLWLHESGISWRGLLGYYEMRWADIEKIYFVSYDITMHFVTLGVFYRLKLTTKQGKTLSVGERLHAAKDLAEQIQSLTLTQMYQKALREFQNGRELDFGRIRLNRKTGIRYYKWFFWREIRWKDWTAHGISDSHVNLGGLGKLFQVNISAEKVSNVHVLEHFLEAVRKGTINVGV